MRRFDLLDERGLNRPLLTQLGTCSFVTRQQNVVFQGFTGSGESYLGCVIAKRACEHRIRVHYARMPTSRKPGLPPKTRHFRRVREVPPQIRRDHVARH
ncbi:ATP-binding protein [Cryobacterium sp. Sr3]|uniref:ATP-binding protein n=1 Tax=Cryobacterium sp. Sr3 TaxID=1259194 RepID=UPI0024119980|nr:ATP-binding protein [Cryobacterium sp. Sr3]